MKTYVFPVLKTYVFSVMKIDGNGEQVYIDADTIAEAWYKVTRSALSSWGDYLESIELVTIIER